jgi:glucose-6-phosphate isomerase
MANWSEKNFKSDYQPIKEKRGACYYAITAPASSNEGPSFVKWVKNMNYVNIPELKIGSAADFNWLLEKFGINPAEPMYNLVNDISKLDFLKNPQKYEWPARNAARSVADGTK